MPSIHRQGKLKDQLFPWVDMPLRDRFGVFVFALMCRPSDVIVFMVGGATYEEARAVSTFNDLGTGLCYLPSFNVQGMRVVLGCTAVHNFQRSDFPLFTYKTD